MALKVLHPSTAPKPVLFAAVLTCFPGRLGLILALPLTATKPWLVNFHIDKMGITKLCSRTNILLILSYQFTAYVRSFVGAPCPAGSEIF